MYACIYYIPIDCINHIVIKVIFESQLQGFLRQIQQESTTRYEHFLSNLATRLDYNDYYSTVLSSSAGGAPFGSAPPSYAGSEAGDRGP